MPPTIGELRQGFELGPWSVDPERDLLIGEGAEEHVEPMVMDVLVVLASAQGHVVSKDELVNAVWGGRSTADEAIATKIAVLRNKLGDDSRNPTYIETVQKRGYRLKMAVKFQDDDTTAEKPGIPGRSRLTVFAISLAAIALAITLVMVAISNWPRSDPVDSVAVLQFRNLSGPDNQYQVDGFSEELVVSLSRVRDLKVTRGSVALALKSANEVARELGVAAIVRGSMRTSGTDVKITAELVSKSGFQIWTEGIDGTTNNIFEIQEQVAEAVRDAISAGAAKPVRAVSRPATAEAFDTYMQGLFFLAKRNLASLKLAESLFQETTQIDPKFGPAYLRQAITILLLSDYVPGARDSLYGDALEVAGNGAAADPSIRESMQLVHGFVQHQRGNWAEADSAFEIAFRAPTPHPAVFHWYSRLLADLGFQKEALDQAIIARSLEPASQILNSRVAVAHLWIGDMQSARHYFDVANQMDVGVPEHHLAYTLFLLRDGRFEDARASVKFAMHLAQRDDRWVDPVIDSLSSPANEQRRKAAFAAIEALSADSTVPPYITMALWALFDQNDYAMNIAMMHASEAGAIYELEVIYLEEFANFREHPQFHELLTALGLSGYWRSIGCGWQGDQVTCDR